MTSANLALQFDRVLEDLTAEFADSFSADAVGAVMAQYRAELEPKATITEYLPVLVRRFTREDLQVRIRRPVAV